MPVWAAREMLIANIKKTENGSLRTVYLSLNDRFLRQL